MLLTFDMLYVPSVSAACISFQRMITLLGNVEPVSFRYDPHLVESLRHHKSFGPGFPVTSTLSALRRLLRVG